MVPRLVSILALLIACLSISEARADPTIDYMKVKTGDSWYASLDAGWIDMEIFDANYDACKIDNLDGDGNNFIRNEVDQFTGEDLGDCQLYSFPNGTVTDFNVFHHGPDAWEGEYIDLYLTDGTVVKCNGIGSIDDNEFVSISCHSVK